MADVTCAICGSLFESRYSGAKYCSTKCKKQAQKAWSAANYLMKKANAAQKVKEVHRDKLCEAVHESRKRGMSYGQYMAMEGRM